MGAQICFSLPGEVVFSGSWQATKENGCVLSKGVRLSIRACIKPSLNKSTNDFTCGLIEPGK